MKKKHFQILKIYNLVGAFQYSCVTGVSYNRAFFFFFFFWQITLKRFVKILELEIQKNLFQWQGFSNELFSQFLTNCFSLPILSEFKLINFQEKRSQLNSLNSPKIRPQIWRRSPFAPLLIKRFNSKIKNTNSAVSLFTALIEEDTDV